MLLLLLLLCDVRCWFLFSKGAWGACKGSQNITKGGVVDNSLTRAFFLLGALHSITVSSGDAAGSTFAFYSRANPNYFGCNEEEKEDDCSARNGVLGNQLREVK